MSSIVLDVVFVVVGCLILFLCIKRGFFRTMVHLLRILLALLAAYFWGSKAAVWLSEHFFYSPIYNSVYQKLEQLYQSATEKFNPDKIISAFPSFIMTDSVKNEIYGMEESGEVLVVRASNSVASVLSGIVSSVVGYFLVFVAALLLLWLISFLVGKLIRHLPILNTIDRILGGLLGLLIAFCVLSLAGTLIRFFWEETDFYARSTVVRFFGDLKVPDGLSFLDFYSYLSKMF